MIGYIKGNVLNASEGVVLLENNGIGYEITCSASVYQKLLVDKKGEVYTYLAVREDDVSLYGFISLEEKNMFLKLITVNGVGPKMGITILSSINISTLATMIATEDIKGLSKLKGLGKKTAERIIVELREKMQADYDSNGEVIESVANDNTPYNEDAVMALMSLGFSKTECINVVKAAAKEGITAVEQVIAYSLKNIK